MESSSTPDALLRAYVRWAPGTLGKRAIVSSGRPKRPRDFRARTIHGAWLRGDQRLIMPRCIYWFGVWEPLLSRWIEERLGPGDVFVDVGANMGYFTLLASRVLGPQGSVVAIEPAPQTFRKLTTNLGLNRGVGNVRAIRAAVGAREDTIPFFRAPWNDAESSTMALEKCEPAGTVPAAPLARLLTEEELAHARVIKIDVEGAEWDVVEGLVPDIGRFRRDLELVIEVHPNPGEQRTAATLAEALAPDGFEPSWLPVDFGELAHLQRRPVAVPTPGLPPQDRLVHLVLSRRPRSRTRNG